MVEPLIHAKTEGGSTEFLAKLGGEESLINLTGIETRTPLSITREAKTSWLSTSLTIGMSPTS